MTTIIGGSSPSITFSDSTTQASAGLTAASPTIASGVLTFPDATTQSSGSGVAKAWVCFNGNTGATNAAYNVSSVTRNGTGDYTANFTNSFTDAFYSAVGSNIGTNANNFSLIIGNASGSKTTTTCRFGIILSSNNAAQDSQQVNFVAFR
jgi:hypothetical protein